MAQRPASPTVRRKELANTLRRLRAQSRLTLEDAARHIETSAATLSRIETGIRIPRARDVRDLVELYGVTDAKQVARLVGLVAEAKEPGWWEAYSEVDDEYATFIGLEAEATTIEQYELGAVPALLQTPDYSRLYLRAVVTGRHIPSSDHDIERLVEIRQRRWENLTRPSLRYSVIIDEGALRRRVGNDSQVRDQLQRLLSVSQLPNVIIRILSLTSGVHPGQEGGFVLLSLPQEAVSDVVYIDNLAGQVFLEDPAQFERFRRIFEHLEGLALSEGESVDALRRMAERP